MKTIAQVKILAENWLAHNVCWSIRNGTQHLRDRKGNIIATGRPSGKAWQITVEWADRHIWRDGVPDYTNVELVDGIGTFFHPVAYACQWDGSDERNIAFQWRELFQSDGAGAFRRYLAYLPDTGEFVARAFAWQPAYEQQEPDIACPNRNDLGDIVERFSTLARARRIAIRRECAFWTALVLATLADPRELTESVVTVAQAYLSAVDGYMRERFAARNGEYRLWYDAPRERGAMSIVLHRYKYDGTWRAAVIERSVPPKWHAFPPCPYEQAVAYWLTLLHGEYVGDRR